MWATPNLIKLVERKRRVVLFIEFLFFLYSGISSSDISTLRGLLLLREAAILRHQAVAM